MNREPSCERTGPPARALREKGTVARKCQTLHEKAKRSALILEVAASLQRSAGVCTASRGGNFGNKLLTEITHAEWLKRVDSGPSDVMRQPPGSAKEPPFEVSYQTARFDPIVPFAKVRFGIDEGCSGCFCRAWAFARL